MKRPMKISELEAKFIALWSRRHLIGGPDWVAELPEPEFNKRFHPVRKWRFDFMWPAYRVAVEIDGGTYINGAHSRGPGIDNDNEKRNTARELGWRVFQFTGRDLQGKWGIKTIQTVANTLRQGPVADIQEQLPLF